MDKINNYKECNKGIISLIFSILGVIFSFTSIGGKSIGQHILNILEVKFPYIFISIILFILSIFIGYRHKNDPYSKQGIGVSIGSLIICGIFTLISMFFY
ncbi:hypothetical protein [Clostridium sp. 1001275B_160808_H3]|uniref:hypothetical protein n=1 Tax=Clostridium sp. 1001275B_160808_H3 TaxID=2787110 RepID=UPI001896FB31|nr:hypothetical protein [Clostridium sp. 1001275B_160808_H3]